MTQVSSRPFDIAIVGGGPSGLMAAQVLAQAGHQVTIYDQMPSLGRKFLLAGRGGLNLTHSAPLPGFLDAYGPDKDWMAPIIAGFTPQDAQDWARSLGQEVFVGSSGRVFPKAMKASPLLRAWLRDLGERGVTTALSMSWQGWTDDGALAFVDGRSGEARVVRPDATLLALGGGSWARLGSDGAWVDRLRARGAEVAPLCASNCGIEIGWTPHFQDRFAGTPLKAVAVRCVDRVSRGDVIVTARGLEGGAIYALGPAIRLGLAAGPCTIEIDLRPDQDLAALAQRLVTSKAGQSLSSALKGKLNLSPAAIGLLREACANQLPNTAMGLARRIKAIPLKVMGLAPLDRAISSAGGIARAALTQELMLKAVPGVFAAGEMLNWDAPTGGYLLQACLASGRHAALGMLAWLRGRADGPEVYEVASGAFSPSLTSQAPK